MDHSPAPADLTELISKSVARQLTPEFINNEIDTRIGKLIVELIGKSLNNWSDNGKLIEQAINDALRVDRLDLPSYGHVVTGILKRQIETRTAEIVAGKLSEDMEELLHLAPKEIKLSEIADGMRERYKEYHDHAYGEIISVVVEESDYGYHYIGFDEREAGVARRKCAFEIAIDKEGKIYSATLEGRDIKNTATLGRRWGLDQLIRAWYACGTRIILDEDAVVTSEGDY